MLKRAEVVCFCMTLAGVYEDYPFRDKNWTVMRHRGNKRGFAWIFERNGVLWVNVKAKPELCDLWRHTYAWVVPGYHMNKTHWNSLILRPGVPREQVKNMIFDSYMLTGGIDKMAPGYKNKKDADRGKKTGIYPPEDVFNQ